MTDALKVSKLLGYAVLLPRAPAASGNCTCPSEPWLDEDAANAAGAGTVRMGVLLRISSDPVTRAWSGVGDLTIATDGVETNSDNVYRGVGAFNAIPDLDGLLNGTAARVEFALAGVDATIAELVTQSIDDIDQEKAWIGVVFFDAAEQPVAAPMWFEAVADQVGTDVNGQVARVSLSLGMGPTDRRRPKLSFWSPADQDSRSPGDAFCARTPQYDPGQTTFWPRFG